MDSLKNFEEVYSAASSIYTIGKSCVSFLVNSNRKKKIDDSVKKALDDDVEEVLKENLYDILTKKKEEIKCGNYESVLDEECRNNIVKEIIGKNNNLEIYKADIEVYVQGFIDNALEYLKNEVDDRKLLDTVISLNRITEHNADKRNNDLKNDLKVEIKRVVYEAMNDNSSTNIVQLVELPFEVESMIYKAEVSSGNIVYEFGFDVSKGNYKVVLEDLFVASESKTGLWAFHRFTYFWGIGHTTHQYIKVSSETGGIRIINSSGVVAFFKIYNSQSYYIRVFGNKDNLYYEALTKNEYENKREEYEKKYEITKKIDSDYDDWIKYYASVMYTDFGH